MKEETDYHKNKKMSTPLPKTTPLTNRAPKYTTANPANAP